MSFRHAALILVVLAVSSTAVAAPGEPDRSFGTNGTVLLDLGAAEGADALLPLPGGAFVVAGYGDGANVSARFTAGGARDATYGDGGVVVTPSRGVSGAGVAPVPSFRQDDGKLVSAGGATNGSGTREDPFTGTTRLAVYRADANGRPDPGFGSGGTATLPGENNQTARAVLALQQAGGRILAVGTTATFGRSDTSALLFARFNPDGSLDASFGNGGSRTIPAPALGAARIDVAALAGGGFAVAYCDPRAGGARPRVMRFDPDGAPDDGFSGDGVAEVTGFGCGQGEAHVAVQPDGKLVVGAGTTDVARFGVDGAPDPTFGTSGQVVTPGGDAVAGVVVQPDGRIVVASGDFEVIRFTADGSVDPVFATQALGTSGKSGGGLAEAVALGAGDTILVAGLSRPPATDIKVMRFDAGSGSATVAPLPAAQPLARALASGFEVAATCPTACVVSSELRMDARTARRLGAVAAARTVRVGSGRKRLARAGSTTVRVRFTPAARRALRRQRRVRVTLITKLRPSTGRVTTKRQVLTLRR